MTNKIEQLDEFNSSAGNGANVPDPVVKGNARANRKADNGGVGANGESMNTIADITPGNSSKAEVINYVLKAMSSSKDVQDAVFNAAKAAFAAGDSTNNGQTKKPTKAGASIVAKEDIDGIFAGQDLSEETKEKALTIFEAAVEAKVAATVAELEEAAHEAFYEAVQEQVEEIIEQVDEYLKYVAAEWMAENTLAVESGIRADVTESFLSGMKNLFTEHYVDLPEEATDVVEELAAENVALEEKLNAALEAHMETTKLVEDLQKKQILAQVSEGLTLVEKSKLATLAESVSAEDLEQFRNKATVLKEHHFGGSNKKVITEDAVNSGEPLDEAPKSGVKDPDMNAYVTAISRTLKK